MHRKIPLVCVFCGGALGRGPQFCDAAMRLGRGLAGGGFALIYGGGWSGLMGATAKAAAEAGAHIRGYLPNYLWNEKEAPAWLRDIVLSPNLHLRKSEMMAAADAFVVLPGGVGTCDEFFDVVKAVQQNVLLKPIVVVNVEGFFNPLLDLMRHLVDEGFAESRLLELYAVVDDPEDAIKTILAELQRPDINGAEIAPLPGDPRCSCASESGSIENEIAKRGARQ